MNPEVKSKLSYLKKDAFATWSFLTSGGGIGRAFGISAIGAFFFGRYFHLLDQDLNAVVLGLIVAGAALECITARIQAREQYKRVNRRCGFFLVILLRYASALFTAVYLILLLSIVFDVLVFENIDKRLALSVAVFAGAMLIAAIAETLGIVLANKMAMDLPDGFYRG